MDMKMNWQTCENVLQNEEVGRIKKKISKIYIIQAVWSLNNIPPLANLIKI